MTDLNGTWLGTYWQNGNPTRFEAVIVQGGNTITGSILDDCELGEAQLVGTVTGRCISFIKRYFTTSPEPVDYTGTVSEDENYMQGQWQIGKWYSGIWEARRSGQSLTVDLQTRVAEDVTLSVGP